MKPPRQASPARTSRETEAPTTLSLDYDQLLRLTLKNWKWLGLFVVIGLAIGIIHGERQTPIYAATATIIVQLKDSKMDNVNNIQEPDTKSGDMIWTFKDLLQTKELVSRVVIKDNLASDPDFLPKGVAAPVSDDVATDMLLGGVSVRLRPLTRLIDITVAHPSPEMAQKLANDLAAESIRQDFDQSTGGAHVLSDHLRSEVSELQRKLSEDKQAVQNYRSAHPDGLSLSETQDVTVARLKELNNQYLAAQQQVRQLQERYGPEYPRLILAQRAEADLRQELDQAQKDALALDGTSIGYSTLTSVAESDRIQYENMLHALSEATVAEHVELPGISIAQEAERPYVPISPAKTKEAILGGIGGMAAGLCLILGLYFMDGSLRTVAKAESALHVRVAAAVPILTETELRESSLPTLSAPQSFVAEAFRGLRAGIVLHGREHPVKTTLVCSAVPGEGKSFCAANLAVAFAQAGLKTLLIDADLRLPTAHTYFQNASMDSASGLLDILAGHGSIATSTIASGIPNLSLLLTTTAADSPAELLSGPHLLNLLKDAAAQYDRIVIDTAPLNAVSDTMLILPNADVILLVVRAAQTPASECSAALEKIYSSKMKPFGLILNYLPLHSIKTYAYGYSYGKKPPKK